jgi:hypothetical protein
MLTTEPSGSGFQATLRAQGLLRYFPAAFLCVWLCGWAVGEWFALRMFASLLRSLLGSSFLPAWLPPLGGTMPSGPMVVLFAAFLTFWLTMWTVGGVGAVHQLLAFLFGRDVVRWAEDTLEVEHWSLWLAARSRLAAQDITGFRLNRMSLIADGRKRATRITHLGSEDERQQLAATLESWRAAIAPPAPLAADESPIPEFVALRDETGNVALARAPGARRTVGVLLGVLGLALFGGAASMFLQKTGVALVLGVLVMSLFGTGSLYASVWLLAARETWHMGPMRLVRRRALLGRTWSAEFSPLELQLKRSTDSDGDTRWELVATGADRHVTVTSAIDDPNPPLTLGTWLAERTGARLVRREPTDTLRRAG